MKALILAGGPGTRLRPLTYALPKHLLPIANKPVIEYGIEAILHLGIKEIGIVVGKETSEPLQEHLGDGRRWGARFTYIFQEEPKGLAHCVLCSEDFLGGDPFVMYLGDNLFQDSLEGLLNAFKEAEACAAIALKEVPDPRAFGVAELDSSGRVRRLVEKPKDPPSNLAVLGAYAFDRHIVEAAKEIGPSRRGELEITDAIQKLIDEGYKVVAHQIQGWWKDTGKPDDLLAANRLVLKSLQGLRNKGARVDESSRLQGLVALGEGALVEESEIVGPVIVGDGARIVRSWIGPYTAIGRRSCLVEAKVEDSILMEGVRVEGADWPFMGCIIGAGTEITLHGGGSLQLVVPHLSRMRSSGGSG
ncbi:MAG: glucose-1-phosphate thymidylyltransferase [Chloroflexi bacterium]|nr:MAG: glucose-1-phosphate thymidylyltransferase [Chloroflexota bacterium]